MLTTKLVADRIINPHCSHQRSHPVPIWYFLPYLVPLTPLLRSCFFHQSLTEPCHRLEALRLSQFMALLGLWLRPFHLLLIVPCLLALMRLRIWYARSRCRLSFQRSNAPVSLYGLL